MIDDLETNIMSMENRENKVDKFQIKTFDLYNSFGNSFNIIGMSTSQKFIYFHINEELST